ncbi:hypothetical protein ACFPPA_08880 [Rhodanobacter ginsengisoli]|uniref:Uncharacterized protein n=1 Tax=Rhodanobacter ginsengisoli TaxID=418646 RepID=A0ABW0QM35_9GAMM
MAPGRAHTVVHDVTDVEAIDIEAEQPPVHLRPGSAALDVVRRHLADLDEQITAWEPLSRSTDFPAPASLPQES